MGGISKFGISSRLLLRGFWLHRLMNIDEESSISNHPVVSHCNMLFNKLFLQKINWKIVRIEQRYARSIRIKVHMVKNESYY
jgi:hypothetical protein